MRIWVLAGVIAAVFLAEPASAAPMAAEGLAVPSPIVKVYGGCGPYGHRGYWGHCRRGGQWGGWGPRRICPPGWHFGPGRCVRNWY